MGKEYKTHFYFFLKKMLKKNAYLFALPTNTLCIPPVY